MGAAYGFLFYVRRAPFIVGGVLVTQRQQLLAWRIGAALVFLLTAPYWSMVKMCFFVGLVILAHGTFRTPTRMQMDAGSSKLHGLFDGGAGSDTEVRACVRGPGHARLITLRAPQDVDEEA